MYECIELLLRTLARFRIENEQFYAKISVNRQLALLCALKSMQRQCIRLIYTRTQN